MKKLITTTKSGDKIYSAAYTRSEFIRRCTRFSIEFVHNCLRLILRPNHKSRYHWIVELTPWFYFQVRQPLSIKNRPCYGLFNVVLHHGSNDNNMMWDDETILNECILVSREPYGKVTNNAEIAPNLLKLLYGLVKRESENSSVNSIDLFNEWLEEIPGFVNKPIV